MNPAPQSSYPGQQRTSLYAEKLVSSSRRRRHPAKRSRPRARQAAVSVALDPLPQGLGVLTVLVIILAGSLAWNLAAHASNPVPEQRPDPTVYRNTIDLITIDRVGNLFYGVVSQGFFLLDQDSQRHAVQDLVHRLNREGYRALYLAEADGNCIASWSGAGLWMPEDPNQVS
jgi:hypothetical protein